MMTHTAFANFVRHKPRFFPFLPGYYLSPAAAAAGA